ncbi:MAG: single-stranded DNA-binding protein [Leptolyngbyaceae cyanobacterium]
MNVFCGTGHLGADPNPRDFESGAKVVHFTLYVNERYRRNGQVQERTHRIPIEAWGKTAEYATQYLQSGTLVNVQGSVVENTWTEEGQKRSRLIIKASRIENLSPKPQDSAEAPEDNDEF